MIFEGPERRHSLKGQNVAMDQLDKNNTHAAVVETAGSGSAPPAKVTVEKAALLDDTDSAQGTQGTHTGTPHPDDPKDMTSELTLPSQNPRLSFFDEEYVAGRRVPFPTLLSDSHGSSPDKTLCMEKSKKTSSSDKTAGSKTQPMDASSTSSSSKDGIRMRPTSEEIVGSRKSARNAAKKVYLA